MKKTILTILIMPLMIVAAYAQTPQALNYQAVARNSLGQIVPSQNIGVRFTIQDATGNNVYYQETHATTTNNFGLFTLAIGKGTAVSGGIAAIDWSAGGDKFLKVEIAPQGGTNYTIQGFTQLLSVPYALYSEKTKLVAGNAITITNGNTISASYQAGPGITIAGNTISTTGGAPWLLNGNTGTTASNFLGTTDNRAMYFRTDNIQRLSISESTVTGSINASYITAGQPSNFATNPVSLNIFGKDIRGTTMALAVNSNTAGMVWTPSGGPNNTMGSIMRLAQWPDATQNYHLYDLGIDQAFDFFITGHSTWNAGSITPKKMITISPNNYVGINFNWGEDPTANFHTKGTVRFEGIAANNALTRVMVMDNNGNVSSRDASTLSGASGNDWSLTGNAGTTTANFVGTTDDQRLYFRTNNVNRMYIDKTYSGFGADVNAVYISDESILPTHPGQLGIFGKDIAGLSLPLLVVGSVSGATWGTAGGNTSGRLVRFSQMRTASFTQSCFYDLGIQQDSSWFLSSMGLQNVGGLLPKPMITISAQNNVGINMDWAEKPTANFHTKGTVRFQNLPSGAGNILVVDANGNVFRASQTATKTIDSEKEIQRLQSELDRAKKDIAELKAMITEIKSKMTATVSK